MSESPQQEGSPPPHEEHGQMPRQKHDGAPGQPDDNDPEEPAAVAVTSYPPMKPWHRRLVMFSLCLTMFLSALDITIISTALPTIAAQLRTTAQQYAWIGSGYNLANTASMLVWTTASGVVGRKPAIMAAAATFMAGSLVSARASSGAMLIAGRVVQGLGGGGSMVLVTIVIGDLFPLAERAKYYGMTGMVWGIASAVGPVLGGVFTQSADWRWCFYINLPLDAIALIVLFFYLDVEIKKTPLAQGLRSIDWMGFVWVLGGTISFLYGLELGSGSLAPWGSAKVICLIVFGVVMLAIFSVWEARFAKTPIIPFRIFRKVTNIAAFTIACLHSLVFISFDFFLPLYFQVVLGLKPLISGVTLFALILPLSATTISGGLIVRRTGKYTGIIRCGAALMCLGNGLFILFDPYANWPKIIIFQMIAGAGTGAMFQSPMLALQNHISQEDTAPAMAAWNFLRSLFTSISLVIGTVLIQKTLGGGSLTFAHGGQSSSGGIDKQTYVKALHIMWGFYTAVAGVLFLSTFFIDKKPIQGSNGDSQTQIANKDSEKEAVVVDKV